MVERWGLTPFVERQAVCLPSAQLMLFQLVMGGWRAHLAC